VEGEILAMLTSLEERIWGWPYERRCGSI
jgi:hypothetical protein